jgi:hypothetical protein
MMEESRMDNGRAAYISGCASNCKIIIIHSNPFPIVNHQYTLNRKALKAKNITTKKVTIKGSQ